MNAQNLGAGNKIKAGIASLLTKMRANPLIPAAIAIAAGVAIITVAFLWAKEPPYGVLFNNINDKDGGEIVTQLSQMNVPYRFAESGGAILIPEAKVHEIRLKLAQQGLPKGGSVGFELLDKDRFGISQFNEQINYQRALEGELSRTIETLSAIEKARVHLAIPKPSLFVREKTAPSASVTVTLLPGRALEQGQITAITHLVSSSVANMPADRVTIVDQNGQLLTNDANSSNNINGTQIDYATRIEERVRRRIEGILIPMLGAGNVHAQVTAEIDFSRQEATEEFYGPNNAPDNKAVRSQQINRSEQIGGQGIGGVPGALSNQPTPPASAPIEGNPPAQQTANNQTQNQTQSKTDAVPRNTQDNETTNYELNRTVRHSKQPEGAVKRLSVAVLVNYHQVETAVDKAPESAGEGDNPDAEKAETKSTTEMTWQPLPEEMIKNIDSLTRQAMGYSEQRGDTLTVANTKFMSETDDVSTQRFWEKPNFYDKALEIARYLLLFIVIWIVWRKLIRPFWLMAQKQLSALAPQPELDTAAVKTAVHPSDAFGYAGSETEVAARKKRSILRNNEQQRQDVIEMTGNDPRITALILRNWLNKDA